MPRRLYFEGARAAVPIVLGYIPVGIAFGVLARQSGLSAVEATAMSLLVFAGAAQFIAAGMLAAGAGALAIVATTLVVNLRHFLMSSTVARHLKPSPLPVTAAMAFELTDESFAVIMSAPEKITGHHSFMLGLQTTAQAAWIAGTAIGAVFGPLANGASYGIPFALPALFICLLVLQVKSRQHIVVALAAVTFLPRFLPLAIFNRRPMPRRLERFLHYMPTAVMAAIVFPVLLSWDGKTASVEPILLLSALPVFAFAAWKKNLWGAVLIGMAVYWALSLIL